MNSRKQIMKLLDVRECIQDYRNGYISVNDGIYLLQQVGLEISPFEFGMLDTILPTFPDENTLSHMEMVLGLDELISVCHQSLQGIENLLYVVPRLINSYSGEHLLLQSETTSYHILFGLIWRTERLLDTFEDEEYFSKKQVYEERIKIERLIKASIKSIVHGKNWVEKI